MLSNNTQETLNVLPDFGRTVRFTRPWVDIALFWVTLIMLSGAYVGLMPSRCMACRVMMFVWAQLPTAALK